MNVDPKYISAGLAAIGVIALALAGVVRITTPAEEELQLENTKLQVELGVANTKLELLEEVRATCATALKTCKENCS